ncbi:hypothetical protein EDC01DRAFT_660327 [Geopyxis carbonaria]|nr:hypothetical protein EDC01DRAFT_660327 [Geopyxis carbonaria]
MMAMAATSTLPTGGCQFRLLDKEFTCGCQRFRIKRKRNKGKGIAGAALDLEDDDDDEYDDCRCGHDACFHQDRSPTPTSSMHQQQLQQTSQQLQFTDTPLTSAVCGSQGGRRLSVSTDVALMQRSMNPALSGMSGTTTERDYSSSATPSNTPAGIFKPVFLPEHVRQSQRPVVPDSDATLQTTTANGKDTSRMANSLGSLNSFMHRLTDEVDSRIVSRPASSTSSTMWRGDLQEFKKQLKTLLDLSLNLRNDQISHQDRIETIEALPAVLEDLSEKIELLDDRLDEKQYSFETRIENIIDDRLGPIESFMRSQSAKKRKRRQLRDRESEPLENWSIVQGDVQGDEKRRKRGNSDVINSGQPHGLTTTTTTSFTTTTSTSTSFTSSALPTKTKMDELHAFQYQIDQMNSRLVDIEASGPPTAMRPWDIEIVMIPPSPLLQGAWIDSSTSVASTQYESSEIGPPTTAMARSAIPPTGVMPRSFPPNCKAYKRLFSRGFIRRLHIIGPTAKEVSVAIEASFQGLIDWCSSFTASQEPIKSPRSDASSGSSQHTARNRRSSKHSWQPLRKIYKQVALEYLPTSDISTPALWTVDYLKVNCMMRSRQRKVVYIMPTVPTSVHITWDDIKALPRFRDHDEVTGASVSPFADTEPFWDFDFKLDSIRTPQLAGSSFFSEPFASFGAGASLNAAKSPGPLATPPETAPHLRPQRSSKLNNRVHSDSPRPASKDRSLTPLRRQTHSDSPRPASKDRSSPAPLRRQTTSPRRKKSSGPKITKSGPITTSHSPPSPPMSYPNLTRQGRKKTLPPQNRERSPTIPDSPSLMFTASGASFSAILAAGIGSWQLDSPHPPHSGEGVLKHEDLSGGVEEGILGLFNSFPADGGVVEGAAAVPPDGSPEFAAFDDEEEEEELSPLPMAPPVAVPALVAAMPTVGAVGSSGDGGYHSQ